MPTTTSKHASRAVVITTARRGVFFGYTPESVDAIINSGKVTLTNARMCNYWSSATKGVLGLASIGPQAGSKIGPKVDEFACESITGVMVCSDAAVAAWEAGVWS